MIFKDKITPIDAGQLLDKQFGIAEPFFGRWIFAGSLSMIYAEAGVGKSYFSMALAYAMAAGHGTKFLNWNSFSSKRVIYFDGEMGERLLQNRLMQMIPCFQNSAEANSLSFLTYEQCGGVMWNLADHRDQEKYTEASKDFDVIIIDTLSGCSRAVGRETEFDTWPRIQNWMIAMRKANKAVILLHHAGKNGSQRGPSSRKDALDFCVELRKPRPYDPSEGLKFELRFEKTRHYIGGEGRPLCVSIQNEEETGCIVWNHSDLVEEIEQPKKGIWGRKSYEP